MAYYGIVQPFLVEQNLCCWSIGLGSPSNATTSQIAFEGDPNIKKADPNGSVSCFVPEPCQKELKSFKMPMLLRNDLDTLRHIKSFQAPLQIVEGDMEKALAGSQIGSYSIFQKGFRTLGSVQSDDW